MPLTIQDILDRSDALILETQENSITPPRVGELIYALAELLQQGAGSGTTIGASILSELNDVDLVNLNDGDLLHYSTSKWRNLAINLTLLQDQMQWFKKDAAGNIYTEQKFYSTKEVSGYGLPNETIPTPGSGGVTSLLELDEVNISNPTNGEVLTYHDGFWRNAAPTGSGGQITTESDPTVPSWAKQATKPSYTVAEISGLADELGVKASLNAFNSHVANVNVHIDATDRTNLNNLSSWFKLDGYGNIYTEKNFYSTKEISGYGSASGVSGSNGTTSLLELDEVLISTPSVGDVLTYLDGFWRNAPASSGGITTETDPTVPNWAKQATKPSYTWSEIGSKPTTLANFGITDAVTLNTAQTITGTKTFQSTLTVGGNTADTRLIIKRDAAGQDLTLIRNGLGWSQIEVRAGGINLWKIYGSTTLPYIASENANSRLVLGSYGTDKAGNQLVVMGKSWLGEGINFGNGWEMRAVNSDLQLFYNNISKGGFTPIGFYNTGEVSGYSSQAVSGIADFAEGITTRDIKSSYLKIFGSERYTEMCIGDGNMAFSVDDTTGNSFITFGTNNFAFINNIGHLDTNKINIKDASTRKFTFETANNYLYIKNASGVNVARLDQNGQLAIRSTITQNQTI